MFYRAIIRNLEEEEKEKRKHVKEKNENIKH
jgi:hypothetical protein